MKCMKLTYLWLAETSSANILLWWLWLNDPNQGPVCLKAAKMKHVSGCVMLSDVYCCGPASVKAIKEGDLTKKYDAPFIYAEVSFV